MIDAVLEIPRRFAFSEVAHARHYSSILDTALAYSQHCLRRDDSTNKKNTIINVGAGSARPHTKENCHIDRMGDILRIVVILY